MPRWQFRAPSRWHTRDPYLHISRLSRACCYDAESQHRANVGMSQTCVADAPLPRFMLKWESQPSARSAASAASWPVVTHVANRGWGIMPDVRRRQFILFPTESRPPGRGRRARQSPRGYRRVAAVTHLWRLTAALTAIILLGSLLSSGAEARILVCWWEYPGRMCTIIKSAKSLVRPQWAGNGYRRAPPPCPRGFWAVCGECPC
jgi:hypothetical protein